MSLNVTEALAGLDKALRDEFDSLDLLLENRFADYDRRLSILEQIAVVKGEVEEDAVEVEQTPDTSNKWKEFPIPRGMLSFGRVLTDEEKQKVKSYFEGRIREALEHFSKVFGEPYSR